MNQKNLSIIGVVALLIIAYFWWGGSTSSAPATNDTDATTNVSEVTNNTQTSAPKGSTSGGTTSSYPSMTKDGIYIIYYKPSGFSPNVLNIVAGKSVRFINNSGKAMRIGSADNTNNPIYAAFNQPKTVGQGGIYEYTFNDRGSFSYKNLNASADQGVIVVK